ncbi:hypothetical protein BO94DRAFT_478646 [Aspergillus sclerotioniger CBS 115572]|uniref:Uncharacterized protein n=1 Tax=Aspergillus sclerotioniger CBS 115572 TaxID=1450535 RepID=A0A317V128_9EURO|nr:hypothetical protein BO94DRAFT_478646 [Aspergillus sclerotioniger CBS 115572]PWY68034.1 hypothetical protein BO94DRAFT_478646 [Aspergillus sclerotioniger CBS 115572]
MRFLENPLLVAAIALIPAALAQQDLKGQGAVQVTTADGDLPLGCINSSGQWSVANDCLGFSTAGDSQLYSNNGWLSLNDDGDIVLVADWDKADSWQSTGYSFGGIPSYLVAIGSDTDDVVGGPFWYAPAAPTADEAVVLSASSSDGAQNVTLTWYQLAG